MPLDKFVLILVVVVIAGGATIAIASALAASMSHPIGLAALIPMALVAYVVLRVVAQRLGNRDDDRYDRTPR